MKHTDQTANSGEERPQMSWTPTSQLIAQAHERDLLRCSGHNPAHSGLPHAGLLGSPIRIHQLQAGSKGSCNQGAAAIPCQTTHIHMSAVILGTTWQTESHSASA